MQQPTTGFSGVGQGVWNWGEKGGGGGGGSTGGGTALGDGRRQDYKNCKEDRNHQGRDGNKVKEEKPWDKV